MDVMTMAKEARRHTLGVFHPTFSLLRRVRVFLLEKLPADAHLRASGKLCVSLTRMSDGKNVLVSEFDSREELIQVLMCSCFFPLYCGFIPPSYRGVHYMDGALSNNMPLCENRNTITVAPFSGESDICPREGTLNFCEVHYGNVSIQVNTGNVHRICTSFLPPRPEKLAEICHNGYKDALRFLREKDLLGTQCRPPSLVAQMDTLTCCELMRKVARADVPKKILLDRLKPTRETDHWPDQDVIANLPAEIDRSTWDRWDWLDSSPARKPSGICSHETRCLPCTDNKSYQLFLFYWDQKCKYPGLILTNNLSSLHVTFETLCVCVCVCVSPV
ncbi:patatin-like phospholipase domain-containing protein 2 [Solea senegalensis]|uniref:triacylglycerol lipase n=1 Tax=Solea senegalensis TaxID=28829 RepID=A0AAV6SYZ9_SOLSE|nr:patatin-like phospholipase domain-containing protein 2 [Solea senegalensis]